MITQTGVTIAESGMTARELRELLAAVPDDWRVILAADAEGNGFSPLASAVESMYLADTPWSGEAYPTPEEIAAEDSPYDPNDDAAPDGAERVLLLVPAN